MIDGADMIYILMGVSGSGKTTVGQLLASQLHCGFHDADAFHSEANKAKMHNGIPLTDEDRWPWLAAMRAAIGDTLGIGPERVGIKATTNEQIGFIGREEGIAAIAVALLSRES